MKIIQFTGQFNKLPALGFKFQKLYALNHRCYHNGGIYHEKGLPSFWIWQKGRDIEIEDWHGLSAYIVEFLKEYKHEPYLSKSGLWIDYVSLICNLNTYEIRVRKPGECEHDGLMLRLLKKEISEEKYFILLEEWLKQYRQININPENLLKVLNRLKGMYEIITLKDS